MNGAPEIAPGWPPMRSSLIIKIYAAQLNETNEAASHNAVLNQINNTRAQNE
jgi:hypothetical protein